MNNELLVAIFKSRVSQRLLHRIQFNGFMHPYEKWKNRGGPMIERKLSIAEIILIAGTRVALGTGIGLLLAGRLSDDQRKAAGMALALVGGLTTIPLAIGLISKKSAGLSEIKSAA
jgi:hypothetical protein